MRKVLVLFLLVFSVSCASRNNQSYYPTPALGPQLDEMSLKKSFGDRGR